jgi:probable HAF family extracellular repeat protein
MGFQLPCVTGASTSAAMRQPYQVGFILRAMLFAVAGSLGAQVTVNSLTAIPNTLGGTTSWAGDVNASGVVIGTVDVGADTHAFVYSGGTMTDLGTLGGPYTYANAINSSGLIVGSAGVPGDFEHAFTYAFPGGPIMDGHSTAVVLGTGTGFSGVNSAGHITGYSDTASGQHAIIYSGGLSTDLGVPAGADNSYGGAINSLDHVVGYAPNSGNTTSVAFLYSGGTMHDLGTLGGVFAFAKAINDSDLVVGSGQTSSEQTHAFLYDGSLHDLGTLGGNFSDATGINNAGLIVGISRIDPEVQHSFLYFNSTMYDLTVLAAPYMSDGSSAGFVSLNAYHINDAGQIVGDGSYFDGASTYTNTAFVMSVSAIPEPATYAAFAGLGALGLAAWRRRSVATQRVA